MADYTFGVHADLNFQQLKQAVVHVLTAHPASPVSGQIWYRSDLSNGTGNGVLYMRDASGNNIAVGTGSGSGLTDAYTAITDGTTTTTTSGGETLQFVPSGTGLSVAVVNGNVGFGGRDTVTYTLNSATSGANKVLLLDGSGGIAHGSYVVLGTGSSTAGKLGWSGTKATIGKGSGINAELIDTNGDFTCDGTITFHGGIFLTGGASGTIAGAVGLSSGLISYGDGTSQLIVVNTTSSQTLSNKTLGTDLAAGGFKITGLAAGVSGSDAVNLTQLTAVQQGRGFKDPVACVATSNITLSGLQTIDGYTTLSGDRVLAGAQTTATASGVYIAGSGAWTRAVDVDTAAEITTGTSVLVLNGTNGKGDIYTQTAAISNIASDSQTWVKTSEGNAVYTADGTYVTLTGTQFSVSTSLQAVHTLVAGGTAGVIAHTAAGTVTNRTITGTSNRISVVDGSGASGNPTIDVSSSYVGQTSITTLGSVTTGTWLGTAVALSYGGTGVDASGGSGAATARDSTHLGRPATAPANATNVVASAVGIYTAVKFTITGTGAATSFTCTHNLGNTSPVIGPLINGSTNAVEVAQVVVTDSNTVTVTWNTAPANAATYRLSILG